MDAASTVQRAEAGIGSWVYLVHHSITVTATLERGICEHSREVPNADFCLFLSSGTVACAPSTVLYLLRCLLVCFQQYTICYSLSLDSHGASI